MKKPITLPKKPFAPEILFEEPNRIPNIHPVDELAVLREHIKRLTARADELRDKLLEDGADLKGDSYTALIRQNTRESLDRKAITEAFGEAAVAPFLKKTTYKTVNLEEN